MNNQARQLLFQLLRDDDKTLIDNPQRLEDLLLERSNGTLKREIFLCVQAAREGVPQALLNNQNQVYEVLATQLTRRLHDNYALDKQAARWAVSSWIVVLGLADKFSTPKVAQSQMSTVPSKTSLPLIDNRYIDNGDGTVTDNLTDLHWLRFSLGQKWQDDNCIGEPKGYKWHEALNAAEEFNENGGFAGYSDWHLPFIDELESIIELDKKPSLNHGAFPNTPASLYWSCSAAVENTTMAWSVYFYGGSTYWYGKSSYYFVRLVRG